MNSQTDKSDSTGAALAIIKAESIIYKRGYGAVNLDYNVPITPESVFHQRRRLWRWKNLRGRNIRKGLKT